MSDRDVRALLNRYMEALPCAVSDATAISDDRIDLVSRIVELTAAWPRSSERMGTTLDEICRKLSVAKGLKTFYEARWRRAADGAPLGAAALTLLACVLLACSCPNDSSEASRGRALKYLNASLSVLDLARQADGRDVPVALRDWCEELLAEVEAAALKGSAL